MDNSNKEKRVIGFAIILVIWGTILVVTLLNILKHLLVTIDINNLVWFVVSLVMVIGVMSGNIFRILLVIVWLVSAAIGFLMFVFGLGWEIGWMGATGMTLMIIGPAMALFLSYTVSSLPVGKEKFGWLISLIFEE